MKNTKKLVLKIVLWTLGSFVGLFLLLWGGLNIAKFFIYSEYYDIKREICKIPGISDGLVCQGLCATDRGDRILVSGYMNDGSASRIYITNLKGESHYVTLTKKGEDLYGHVGGIACHGNTVYLVDDSTLYAVTLSELVNSKEGDSIDLSASATVNNDASFCYADDEYVYVGEFHDGKNYFTDHPYDTDDGTYYAIMSRYKHSDLTKPDKVYSIRNKVQGMCMTDEGKIAFKED